MPILAIANYGCASTTGRNVPKVGVINTRNDYGTQVNVIAGDQEIRARLSNPNYNDPNQKQATGVAPGVLFRNNDGKTGTVVTKTSDGTVWLEAVDIRDYEPNK